MPSEEEVPIVTDWLSVLIDALEMGETVAMATLVGPEELSPTVLGRRLLLRPDGTTVGSLGAESMDEEARNLCRTALLGPPQARVESLPLTPQLADELGLDSSATLRVLVEIVQPQPTLLVVGAGHIGRPLGRMGKELGFRVAVLDDRQEFASLSRFPDADQVIVGDFGEELSRFPITRSTYVVLVTRGHLEDERALRQVIGSSAAYVGMIGSRRRVRAVLDRLEREGVSRELIGRIYSPIGLEIGAETPEEIAVSILAEVIHVRRHGDRHPSSSSARDGRGVGEEARA